MIPNIPTIAPPAQRIPSASPDMLREVCACVCMKWMTCEPWTPTPSRHAKLFLTVHVRGKPIMEPDLETGQP